MTEEKITNNGLWSIEQVWNEAITQKQRELKVRDYIHAGEIGKNFYERYLKMNATEPDTPFNDRVLRKFSAGLWFEDQIGSVLSSMGILKSAQESVEVPESDKCLRVSGRLDYVAGGIVDWDEAVERVKKEKYPEFVESASLAIIEHFKQKFPEGLEEVVIEVKSVNSQVFWAKKDYLEEAYPHHVMQLYTYLLAKNIEKGIVLYISKDDLTIKEQVILKSDQKLTDKWYDDVEEMTKYWRNLQEPPKPEDVVFDKRKKIRFQMNKKKYIIQGAWTENWEVKWSQYFKTITGCENEDEWMSRVKPIIAQKNAERKEEYKKTL